jgi:hypothetical protein
VENLAYLFGLMIVLGTMLTAFIITGAISSDDISNTQTVARNITGTITSTINRPIAWLTSSLQSYLPFVFGTGSLKIAVTGTLIVGILALLDRFLKRKFVR